MQRWARGDVQRIATRIVASRIALAGGTVGGVSVGAIACWLVHGTRDAGTFVPAATTAFVTTFALSTFTVVRSLRKPAEAGAQAFPNTIVAAVANCPAWALLLGAGLVVHELCTSTPPHTVRDWMEAVAMVAFVAILITTIGAIVGLVASLPLGLAFAIVYTPAVGAVGRALVDPTRRAVHVARAVALGLHLTALVPIAALWLGLDLPTEWVAPPMGLVAACAIVDALLLASGWIRERRFLAAVRRGAHAEWRLTPLSECAVDAEIAPLEPLGDAPPLAVVAAREATPYRSLPTAVTLVPSSRG